MTDTPPIIPAKHESAFYEIQLKGHLSDQWAEWFGEVAIRREEDGTTRLTCPALDQAALYGLIKKVRSLGLPLLSVKRIETSQLDEGKEGLP